MCRHLGYLGEPVPLADLVLDPPHSLAGAELCPEGHARRRQGQCRRLRRRLVRLTAGRPAGRFGQYRRAVPIWQDAAFPGVARATTATGALAAVRNATAGMPIADAACAPFTDGAWLFSLNGYLAGWPDTAAELAADLPPRELLGMQVVTDAVLLWTLLRQRLAGGADPAAVLGGLIAEVLAVAPGSRLTTLLTDGRRLYATTVTHSLCVTPLAGRRAAGQRALRRPSRIGSRSRTASWWSPTAGECATSRCPSAARVRARHQRRRAMSISVDDSFLDSASAADELAADARTGLTATPKSLPPRWFYDARGSELFEQITELPEYYPTRTEAQILRSHADDIASAAPVETVIELGSGSSTKTQLLLDAWQRAGTLRRIITVDVSTSALAEAAVGLSARYPAVDVQPVRADFTRHLDGLAKAGRTAVVFLGSTIGNLDPAERAAFFGGVRSALDPGDVLLLGTDLVKPAEILVPAYDDAAGVTAAFNLNVLHVLNRELDGDLPVEAFEHRAVWNPVAERIEMRLRARPRDPGPAGRIGLAVHFDAGEELLTEISSKFRREGITAELAAAGLELTHWWTDPARLFALSLSR